MNTQHKKPTTPEGIAEASNGKLLCAVLPKDALTHSDFENFIKCADTHFDDDAIDAIARSLAEELYSTGRMRFDKEHLESAYVVLRGFELLHLLTEGETPLFDEDERRSMRHNVDIDYEDRRILNLAEEHNVGFYVSPADSDIYVLEKSDLPGCYLKDGVWVLPDFMQKIELTHIKTQK